MTFHQKQIIVLPLLLIASTIGVGMTSAQFLSRPGAFLVLFLFYWVIWCYGIPLFLLGRNQVRSLYGNKLPSPQWLAVLLLLMPFGGTLSQVFIPELGGLTMSVLMVTLVASLINGPGEELFWRGLFTSVFPRNKWLGIVYPSICFGLWHFALLSISGLHHDWILMVFGPMILGLCWGWIAQKSGSILWISISHILVNIFALIGRMFLLGEI